MIAVDQERVVALVVHNLENGCHCLDRYRLLLGALHCDVPMLDSVGLHKRDKRFRQVLVDKCTDRRLARCAWDAMGCRASHNGLQLQPLKKGIISLLRIAAPVDSRNHGTEIGGLAENVPTLDRLL